MSDEEKRALEKRWIEDGDRAALVGWLRLEVRAIAGGEGLRGKARAILSHSPFGMRPRRPSPEVLRDIADLLVERGVALEGKASSQPHDFGADLKLSFCRRCGRSSADEPCVPATPIARRRDPAVRVCNDCNREVLDDGSCGCCLARIEGEDLDEGYCRRPRGHSLEGGHDFWSTQP